MKTNQMNGSTTMQVADLMANPEKGMPKRTLAKHNILPAKSVTPGEILVDVTKARNRAVYDQGIAQSIANGEIAVNYLIIYGVAYNPSNGSLTIANLQAKNVEGNLLISTVQANKQENTLDINNRQLVYADLPKLATRVINELEASGASKKVIADARHYVDKIRGHRIIPIDSDNVDQKHISACQTSFTQQVQHLNGLIGVVSTEPLYNPNVADLKVTALEAKRDAMIASNQAAYSSHAKLSASRLERNHFFNEAHTGYVDTYLAVKRAVKAIFGAASPEYHQISALAFKRIRN